MGALQNSVSENELEPIVKKWRASSPNIVQFWYALEDASIEAVKWHHATTVNGIGLPSGTVHRVTSFSQLQPDILISSYRNAGNDPARSQNLIHIGILFEQLRDFSIVQFAHLAPD